MKKKQASSTIRIEKVALSTKKRGSSDFVQFVTAVRDLKVGESFTYATNNNHRIAIQTLRAAYDYSIVVNATDQKGIYRIGRIG